MDTNSATENLSIERLFTSYFDDTYRYIYSNVKHKETAEDLTSDLWHKIMLKLDKFSERGEGSFKAWAFTLAHNLIIDFYRSNKNHDSFEEINKITGGQSDVNNKIMAINVEGQILFELCSNAIFELPEKQAESIRLKYYSGFRNNEIASLLGVSEKTVSTNLIKGLKTLRTILDNK